MRKIMRAVSGAAVSALMAAILLTGCGSTPASSSSAGTGSSGTPSNSASSAASSSTSGSTASSSKQDEVVKPLKVERSAYYTLKGSDDYYVYYSFTVTNPNQTRDFAYVKADYSIKDEEGRILKANYTYIPPIAAGDTVTFGDYIWIDNGKPAAINFQIDTSTVNAKLKDETKYAKQSELKVFNTARIPKSYGDGVDYTGEITNTSKAKIGYVDIRVFYFKDGKLLAGRSDTVFDLNAGQTKAFQITTYAEPADYDSYQIIAVQDSN